MAGPLELPVQVTAVNNRFLFLGVLQQTLHVLFSGKIFYVGGGEDFFRFEINYSPIPADKHNKDLHKCFQCWYFIINSELQTIPANFNPWSWEYVQKGRPVFKGLHLNCRFVICIIIFLFCGERGENEYLFTVTGVKKMKWFLSL